MKCDSCGVEFCMYDLGAKIKFGDGQVVHICPKCWQKEPTQELLDKIKPKTGVFKCYDCSAHGDFGEYKCPNCGGEYVRRKEVLK